VLEANADAEMKARAIVAIVVLDFGIGISFYMYHTTIAYDIYAITIDLVFLRHKSSVF
jgi:hypothetical protein